MISKNKIDNAKRLNKFIADCSLEVTKFGVRFIQEKDVMQLANLNGSATELVRCVYENTLRHTFHQLRDTGACEAAAFLRSCHSSVNHDLSRSIAFICGYGGKQHTLVDMHIIVKRLIEIHLVLSECKEEWSHPDLFPLVNDYYVIIHETSLLYNEFLRLLKTASDSWLSVKLALEQIVAKSRTENGYNYQEMLEQLNDLEGAEGISFCDDFIASFACICMRIVSFSRHSYYKIPYIKKCKLRKTLTGVSSITITCILSILATYMLTEKKLQQMKGASSCPTWFNLVNWLFSERYGWKFAMRSYGRELCIWDFSANAVVVQELKMKMARFTSFTRENEEEMMIVINKLEKMMDSISATIEDMSRHAQLYSLDIREARITLSQLVVDKSLELPVTAVRFFPLNEEQQYDNPVSEAMGVLHVATLSLIHTNLHRYIRACEEADDSILPSCHSLIHGNTTRIIKIIRDTSSEVARRSSIHDIHKAVTSLHAINQEGFKVLSECKEEWKHDSQLFDLVNDYHKICLQTYQLYNDFVRFLKGQCDSWLSEMLTLKELVVNCRGGRVDSKFKEKMLHLNCDGTCTLSGDLVESFAYICKHTVSFARHFNEEIRLESKSVKVLAKVSSGLIAGLVSLMVAYMVGYNTLDSMEEETLTCVWLLLIRNFSWKVPNWDGKVVAIREISNVMNYIMGVSSYAGYTANMTSKFIDFVTRMINKLSVTIEEMRRHAHEYSGDIIKAGITLDLISRNHMLANENLH